MANCGNSPTTSRSTDLQEPIVLFQDNSEEPKGATGPFPYLLLDGVNRYEAIKVNGIKDPYQVQYGKLRVATVVIVRAFRQSPSTGKWEVDCDPAAMHLSLNVYRRHLTSEQRRWQIKRIIVTDPTARPQGRQKVRASSTTVLR
jgi:hypothetical protein